MNSVKKICIKCGRTKVKISPNLQEKLFNYYNSKNGEISYQKTNDRLICYKCNSHLLGANWRIKLPIADESDTFFTIDDIDKRKKILTFSHLKFTRTALDNSLLIASEIDYPQIDLESCKLDFLKKKDDLSALVFSQKVCEWGRVMRVWGNLLRYNKEKLLGNKLNNWLLKAEFQNPKEAISDGIDIKGLSISCASKHLRLLYPNKFAVLDDILVRGLGFADNPAGYSFFISELIRFKLTNKLTYPISKIESGIFILQRQLIRNT